MITKKAFSLGMYNVSDFFSTYLFNRKRKIISMKRVKKGIQQLQRKIFEYFHHTFIYHIYSNKA